MDERNKKMSVNHSLVSAAGPWPIPGVGNTGNGSDKGKRIP